MNKTTLIASLIALPLEDHIEDIIAKVTPIADEYGLDRGYLEAVYRKMMDESIERKGERWQQLYDFKNL